jgi:P4 family phage/plasmid primase-like protien
MEELKRFLTLHRCEKGAVFTHTSIAAPAGTYRITEEDAPEFVKLYKRAMMSGASLHFTEKPTAISPMRVDLDFRFSLPEPGVGDLGAGGTKSTLFKRMYLPADIERIVGSYVRLMKNYLDVPAADYQTIVMEKPAPTEYRSKMKDGLHIMWPNLHVSTDFQYWIRHQVLENMSVFFSGIPFTNPADDVVDRAIIDRNNWQMYGSTKPDAPPYRVSRVYDYDPDSDELAETTATVLTPEFEMKCVESLSVRRPETTPLSPLKPEVQATMEEYVKRVLPSMDTKRKSKLISEIFGKSQTVGESKTSREEFELAVQIVRRCLNRNRSDNYEEWIKLGWVLHNIDYRLLDTWLEFSSFSSKYNEGECRKLWHLMRNDTLGMGTLRWWAKKDNEMEYEAILSENVMILIDTCIGSDGAHFDVARVVHALYKDAYRFTGKECWYVFRPDKHRWIRSREGLQLRLLLSNEICRKFIERSIYWGNQGVVNPEARDACVDKSTKLAKISTRLKTCSYKDGVMKECKCLFTDEHFEEYMDSKPHLIGFENGVYDLRMHEFREGLPDDYISFSTHRHYTPFQPDHEAAIGVDAFFKSVFPNADMRAYIKDILTSVLDGGIRQERFYVFTGSGCHAPDTLIRMYDGGVKKVQEVAVGDLLMGDDRTPRTVLQLFSGEEPMVCIRPMAGTLAPAPAPYVVNVNHVLALKSYDATTGTVRPWMCKVKEYMQVMESMTATQRELFTHRLYTLDGQTMPFEVESVGCGAFHGFELDGNHLYATADNIVHHNSNGKSKLLELVQKAIGDYYCILPVALLTQKRTASNSAQSELERTKGRRFAVMQEPGESEKLNTGLMKELSGGDRILVRGLFKDPIEFRPQFKMILTCNELPEVQSDDGGTWRRIRVIKFVSKFVENPNPAVKTEFPIDMELSEKFDLWADMFVSMLIQHHKTFDPKKMVEPMEVRIATEGYKQNNDIIGQYSTERITANTDPHAPPMQLNKLYTDFRNWASMSQQKGKRLPDRNQFRAYLEKTYGGYPANGKGWKTLRMIKAVSADDDSDSDAE